MKQRKRRKQFHWSLQKGKQNKRAEATMACQQQRYVLDSSGELQPSKYTLANQQPPSYEIDREGRVTMVELYYDGERYCSRRKTMWRLSTMSTAGRKIINGRSIRIVPDGTRLRKYFEEHGWFWGVVDSSRMIRNDDGDMVRLYRVVYDDKDVEDLGYQELIALGVR